jgi:hypothetical protein
MDDSWFQVHSQDEVWLLGIEDTHRVEFNVYVKGTHAVEFYLFLHTVKYASLFSRMCTLWIMTPWFQAYSHREVCLLVFKDTYTGEFDSWFQDSHSMEIASLAPWTLTPWTLTHQFQGQLYRRLLLVFNDTDTLDFDLSLVKDADAVKIDSVVSMSLHRRVRLLGVQDTQTIWSLTPWRQGQEVRLIDFKGTYTVELATTTTMKYKCAMTK